MDKDIPSHLNKWNWGAFVLNWLWGIGNNTYSAFKVFIPFYGFYYIFKLGFNGSEYAWQNGKWENEAHFVKVQRNWSIASACYVLLFSLIIIPVIYFAGSVFKDSDAYKMTLVQLENSPQFMNKVGMPNETSFVSGQMTTVGHEGSSNMSFTITGAKGQVDVFVDAERRMGVWKLECVKANYIGSDTEEYFGECRDGS